MSGKEAESLHMEEEDFSEEERESEDDEDPLKKIIQSRYLFLFYISLFYFLQHIKRSFIWLNDNYLAHLLGYHEWFCYSIDNF